MVSYHFPFNVDIMKVVCFVPSCKNSKDENPDKLFLCVPRDQNRRNMWLNTVGLDVDSNLGTTLYACEDHFEVISAET